MILYLTDTNTFVTYPNNLFSYIDSLYLIDETLCNIIKKASYTTNRAVRKTTLKSIVYPKKILEYNAYIRKPIETSEYDALLIGISPEGDYVYYFTANGRINLLTIIDDEI
jgi:hypothetical protein